MPDSPCHLQSLVSFLWYLFSEVYEAGTSTDEDTEKDKAKTARQLEMIRRRTMNKETTAKRIMKETVTMEDAKKSVTSVSLLKCMHFSLEHFNCLAKLLLLVNFSPC